MPRAGRGSIRGPLPAAGPPRGPKGYRRALVQTASVRTIAGQTQDSLNLPLASCTVVLFLSTTNQPFSTTTSDASGNYSFQVPDDGSLYYAVAYKSGAPDVEGTTVNTLVGT